MEKTIELSCYEIIIQLDKSVDTPDGRWDGGNLIHSKLKDECPACKNPNCYAHCEESTETDDEWLNRHRWNTAMDALESMILAHAIAGIDVESPAYIEGIETTCDALSNNSF